MNNFRTIAMAVAAMLLAAACSRPAYEMPLRYRPDPELQILNDIKEQTILPPGGGQGVIEVDTELDLMASPQRPWLEVKVEGNKVYFSAPANVSIESRYSNLTIVAEDKSSTFINIQQLGYVSAGTFSISDQKLMHGVQELSVPYDYPYPITVSTDANWIDFDIKSDELIIKVTLNDGTADRKATVKWALGIQNGSFEVFQFCADNEPVAFKKVSAWKPKYVGRDSDGKDEFGVDVTAGSNEGKYFFYVLPSQTWVAAGSADSDEFLEALAADALATKPAFYTASATELVPGVAYGSYRIYAFGVDVADGENTGKINHKYAVAQATIEKQMSPYEKWLGTWSVPRGNETDVWTITQKVADVSYNVTGLEGITELVLEGVFNPTDGSFSVASNGNLGTEVIQGENAVIGFYALCAIGNDNYYITGDYVVFIAKMGTGGKATIVAGGDDGYLNLGEGYGNCPIVSFCYIAETASSAYGFSNEDVVLPISITQLTSGATAKAAPRHFTYAPFLSSFGKKAAF